MAVRPVIMIAVTTIIDQKGRSMIITGVTMIRISIVFFATTKRKNTSYTNISTNQYNNRINKNDPVIDNHGKRNEQIVRIQVHK